MLTLLLPFSCWWCCWLSWWLCCCCPLLPLPPLLLLCCLRLVIKEHMSGPAVDVEKIKARKMKAIMLVMKVKIKDAVLGNR